MLDIPTCKITEYIADILLLLSTSDHSGVEQDDVHDSKINNDDYDVMAYVDY